MPRTKERLRPTQVRSLKQPGLYADGGGLYLRIAPGSTKSWVFRWARNGRTRDMGLGSLDGVSLSRAREKATACRAQVADGIDPIEVKHGARQAAAIAAARASTFEDAARACIKARSAGWRSPKHERQWMTTLEAYVFPAFGAVPVDAVDVAMVLKVLEPIWTTKPETASRVRGRVESVLDWATARGYRTGDNPARWRGHLQNLLPATKKVRRVKHHSALPYTEAGAFVAALRQQEGVAAAALEFTILTGARTGEVIGALWAEFDLGQKVWTIPAERTKTGREHRVPLARQTLALLRRLPLRREDGFVFPGRDKGRPLSNMAMLVLLDRMGQGGLTVHGFRSTFRDWTAERTNFPQHVAEMALGHTISDAVEAAYRRGEMLEKRQQLAQSWADYCDHVTSKDGPAEVVTIRQRTMIRPSAS